MISIRGEKSSSSYDVQSIFSWNLRNERYRQNMSQETLAEMAGCSVDTVKRYESGFTGMKLNTANSLAQALNLSLSSMLSFHEETSADQALNEAEDLIQYARNLMWKA